MILDLIGDVHGCGQTLGRLLRKLGYEFRGGAYRHSERRAVFIGDLFDRGPRVRLAAQIARSMVEADQADWVLGNHELDVMGLALDIRPMTRHAQRKTQATFEDFDPGELCSLCQWLTHCPLWLDCDQWRAVHACWDDASIARLAQVAPKGVFGQAFERLYLEAELRDAADILVRGPSLPMPNGRHLLGGDGIQRKSFRVAFWLDEPDTLGDLVFQPDPLPSDVQQAQIQPGQMAKLPHYAADRVPLFFGHYWRRGRPSLLAPNLVCLDYSAVLREKLVCYSLEPGQALDSAHFNWIQSEDEWH